MMRDLHYGWPLGIDFIFLLIVWAFLFWNAHRSRQRILLETGLLPVPRSRLYELLQGGLYLFSWLFCTLALMQPLANAHYPGGGEPQAHAAKLRLPSHEVILLADASASMGVADMHNGQTRFQYMKQVADEVVSQLNGERVSLYGFTRELFLRSPATLDYLFVRLMLNGLAIDEEGVAGTDLHQVLTELRSRLLQSPMTTLKTVVLFSDGGDTAIEAAGEQEKSKLMEALMDVATDLLKLNVRIYTVGMGSLQGGVVPGIADKGQPVVSRLNETILKRLAEAGHGKYFNANGYTALDGALLLTGEINQLTTGSQGQDVMNSVNAGDESLVYDEYYQIPLAIAMLFLLLAMYMPRVRVKNIAWMVCLAVSRGSLDAQEIRQAVILSEALEYDRAIGVLESVGESKLKTWQEETLTYDEATLFLLQGDWSRALATFNTISLLEDLPPVLATNLRTNIGIAYLEKARALLLLDPPPFAVILTMLGDAKKYFNAAGEGRMPNPDSSLLESFAARELETALQKSSLMKDPVYEGAPVLSLKESDIEMEIAKEKDRRVAAHGQLETPNQVLEEVILEETFAGALLHMALQGDENRRLKNSPWVGAQVDVLKTLELFLPAMVAKQSEGYRSKGENRCQARPWDRVVPLFERGRQEAKAASVLLGQEKLSIALQYEARALVAWQQALAILNKPVTETGSPCQSDAAPKKPQGREKQEQGAAAPKQGAGTNDILRILQELNEDDKLPKKEHGINKQVQRPW